MQKGGGIKNWRGGKRDEERKKEKKETRGGTD